MKIKQLEDIFEEHGTLLDEGKRKDATSFIENISYNIGLHFLKLKYMRGHTASNHWEVELRAFINDTIGKTRKAKIKPIYIYELMSSVILSVQMRNKMIREIHDTYGYIQIDLGDVYTFLDNISKELSVFIDKGTDIEYNDIQTIYLKSL